MQFGLELLIIIIMLFLNGIFSAYEMSLASISRARLALLVEKKKRGAAAAAFMKDKIEASFAVIQLGITLCGAIAAATGGAGIEESLSPYFIQTLGLSHTASEILSLTVLVIPLSAFTIVFAELFPKMFALNNTDWVCLKLSPAMKIISKTVYPIVAVLEWSVKKLTKLGGKHLKPSSKEETETGLHELKAAVNLARASRLIGPLEEKIVLSASQLSQRYIEEIIVPAKYISIILLENHISEALIHAHLDMHTRYPVCTEKDNPQTIQGYVNFKDIVTALKQNPSDPSLKSILRPILKVKNKEKISSILEIMMKQKNYIALVENESQVLGMVTLQDILEELIGEIQDEQDLLPSYVYPYATGWLVGGGIKMTELVKEIDLSEEQRNLMTEDISLAKWIEKSLGRPAWYREVISGHGLKVTVRKLRRKRLLEGLIEIEK